ncbi:MAG TPA: serine hydrolase domain-containing protein [Puia sp.]|nr:serine hydrolase domain-containing protein [Puia sp.]
MKAVLFLVFFLGLGPQLFSQTKTQSFQRIVDSVFREHPEIWGVSVHIESPDKNISWSYAAGQDGKSSGQNLNVDQPVLIASTTKTYIAATIMRLVEMGKLNINQPVKNLLTKTSQIELTKAGYLLDSISVRQLMSHTSGIRDYVDEGYFEWIGKNKQHTWTREEQIARAASLGNPLGPPGSLFKYADINYVLLGEIIEHFTKEPYYISVRKLLDYEGHHLNNTWFIQIENKPVHSAPMVHQYWSKFSWEISELNPSWDLYGGGGIASNVIDMAAFFQLLFNGKIIQNKDILQLMVTDVPPNLEINYCLGVRKIKIGNEQGFNHGGGLGTDVTYFPGLNATIAIALVEADKREIALQMRERLLKELSAQ